MKNKPCNFIDPSAKIGKGTKVWHFAVILADVVIGENCSVGSGTEIGKGSIIGNNSRIGSNVFLPPNSSVGNNVFIGPCVTCTDDKYPEVNNASYHAQPPVIRDGASVGAGVVLLPGIRIGANAMVGAGSVISQNVLANEVIRGERARITRARS